MQNAGVKAKEGIRNISYRGQDACNIELDTYGAIGHCLHALVSNVEQPFSNEKFVFLTNCEVYNWKELPNSRNDAEALFFHLADSNDIDASLKKIDGVYAFALWNKNLNKLFLARDILGVKPLWYYYEPVSGAFAFASERKALISQGLEKAYVRELNPRKIIIYDVANKELNEFEREFFKLKETKDSKEKIVDKTEKLLLNAIKKRIPEGRKVGLLFSGGIDSTFIALVLKKLKVPFTCYTAGLKEEGLKDPEDLEWAKKIAKELDLDLKVIEIPLKEVPKYLKKILPLVEDNNVVKAGVALPFYLCAEEAAKDDVKVLFSGLGSEEIFAGYERHKKSYNINEECLSGLRKIYERDLYRDDVITMKHTIELRLPFLDKRLVEYALNIPKKLKLDDKSNKIVLRMVAKKLGLNEEFADRKKKAAQYGSNFDKAIQKLANKEKKSKSEYLRKFFDEGNVRLGVLMSTGKDSLLAAQIMKEQNYDLKCFITITSDNKDSYMYHGPNTHLAEMQAEVAGLPVIIMNSKGEKEKELKDLKKAIKEAVEKYKIEGIVNGALFSNYQRKRIEKICDEIGIKCHSPLWHMDQEKEVRLLLDKGFKFIIVKIAAEGLDKNWLGREIKEYHIEKLKELNRKFGFNIAFEGGEAETFVVECPLFKGRIVITKANIHMEKINMGTYNIEETKLLE